MTEQTFFVDTEGWPTELIPMLATTPADRHTTRCSLSANLI